MDASDKAGIILVGNILYNLLLHPLRSFPGPWYVKCNLWWFFYHSVVGDYVAAVHQLHLKYGPVVRVAPNELAYTDAAAWKDIYGYRAGVPENIKEPSQAFSDDPRYPNILEAPQELHSKVRRMLSNAFSDKCIREQEPIISTYTDILIDRLRNREGPVDIMKWYTFTTFDVIGHLAFAESFDCLTNSTYHPWISFISSTLKYVAWVRSLKRININAADFLMRLTPERVRREHAASVDMSKQKVLRRKEKKLEYTDFLSHMISAEEKGQLDMGHLFSNAPIIIIAGSETTATLLSGATFYILKYPRVYDALVREIRSTFQRTSDITLSRLSEAKYLLAVLDETLRMYPPVPTTLPRLTPPQGATILGQYVPGNCIVGVNQYAAFHSPLNFNRPEEFIPERFLSSSDDEWKNDQRDALQPFSFGLRNCVGRNLAYAEMRIVFARVLFNFDLELMPNQDDWLDQKVYGVWYKKPLMVKLRPVHTP